MELHLSSELWFLSLQGTTLPSLVNNKLHEQWFLTDTLILIKVSAKTHTN